MNIPNIAKMRKTKKRTTVAQMRAELERLKIHHNTVLDQMRKYKLKLYEEIGNLGIELDFSRKLDRKLHEYMDKLVFVSRNFRWIALASVTIFVTRMVYSAVTSHIGCR